MKNQRFFICEVCGNLTELIKDSNMPMTCCGQEMKELLPNTVEAATEKHIPQVSVSGDTVTVQIGSVEHPMTKEHYIEFIYLQTEHGGQRQCLNAGDKPTAVFKLTGESPLLVYAYCNLHGLWKTEVDVWDFDNTACSAEFTQGCI